MADPKGPDSLPISLSSHFTAAPSVDAGVHLRCEKCPVSDGQPLTVPGMNGWCWTDSLLLPCDGRDVYPLFYGAGRCMPWWCGRKETLPTHASPTSPSRFDRVICRPDSGDPHGAVLADSAAAVGSCGDVNQLSVCGGKRLVRESRDTNGGMEKEDVR